MVDNKIPQENTENFDDGDTCVYEEDKIPQEVEEKILKEVRFNFDNDLKKGLEPLHDIQQSVHKDTLRDLRELFEAVSSFSSQKGFKAGQKQTNEDVLKLIDEIYPNGCEYNPKIERLISKLTGNKDGKEKE